MSLYDAIIAAVASGIILALLKVFWSKLSNAKLNASDDGAAINMLQIALKILPKEERERYGDEWLAFLCEFETPKEKIKHAASFIPAALMISGTTFIFNPIKGRIISFIENKEDMPAHQSNIKKLAPDSLQRATEEKSIIDLDVKFDPNMFNEQNAKVIKLLKLNYANSTNNIYRQLDLLDKLKEKSFTQADYENIIKINADFDLRKFDHVFDVLMPKDDKK